MQNFSAFGCRNTEIAAYQWFRRFRLVFGSDTKPIDPSFCIVQETLITNRHAKFQRFWLRQYRDRRLSVVPVIQARIRVRYETDRSQLLRNLRDSINEPPCKHSAFLVVTIPGSPLISGSGDLGSYSVGYETDRSQLNCIVRETLITNHHAKFQPFWLPQIWRSPLISGSGDSGSYLGRMRN